MNWFEFAQLVVKWVRIFTKLRVKRIERNFSHARTLVFDQTLACIEKYGMAKSALTRPLKRPLNQAIFFGLFGQKVDKSRD
jgi:hypothetical protein